MANSEKKSLKAKTVSLVAGSLAIGVLAGGLGTNYIFNTNENLIDKGAIVATVGDEKITQKDLYKEMLSSYGTSTSQNLVLKKMVKLEAEKKKVKVNKKDIDTKYNSMVTQYGSEDALESALKQSGRTKAELKSDIKTYLMMNKLIEPMVDVSDQAIEAYFKQNKANLGQKEQVEASHILVADKKTALKIIKQLKKGGDWDKLAAKYSTDTANAQSGGQLGYFSSDQMDKDFAKAAFSMKKDEISKVPVKTQYGYHIIKVTGHIDAREATLEGSKAEIKQTLLENGVSEHATEWEEKMTKKYKVKNSLDKDKDKGTNTQAPQSTQGSQGSGTTTQGTTTQGSETQSTEQTSGN